MVALPEGHRLAGNNIVYWTDLKDETFLFSQRDPGPEIQDILLAKLAAPSERPNVISHDVSRENIKSLVGAGFGVSLLCEACIGATYTGVVYREARDGNGSSRISYAAYWHNESDNPALAGFINLLQVRYQSKENAKHTLGAMRENARQGYWNGSRPPFGYKIVAAEQRGARSKKKIEPNPAQVETVQLMFRLARIGAGDGPMGSRQIADYLNTRGIRTPTGGRRGVGAVHQTLASQLTPSTPPQTSMEALAVYRLFVEHPIARMTGLCAVMHRATVGSTAPHSIVRDV